MGARRRREEALHAAPGPRRRRVVRIRAGEPARAYAADRVEKLQDDVDDWSTEEDRDRATADLAALRPLCVVAPGSIHLWDQRGGEGLSFYYRWAPVRCGAQRAYVRWTDTLLSTAIVPRSGGGYRLVQVVEVSCDVASFEEWRYGPAGKQPEEHPTLAARRGGCSD